MLSYSILIFSFGFWNVFKKNKTWSPIFGFSFIATLSWCVFQLYFSNDSSPSSRFLEGLSLLFGLSILGFLLIALSKNKIAQIGAIFLSTVGMNAYLSNPYTPVNPDLELDKNAELIIRLDHQTKTDVAHHISELPMIKEIKPFLKPNDENITDLDDYYIIDIADRKQLDEVIHLLNETKGVEWIEPNEMMQLKLPATQEKEDKIVFSKYVNDPYANRQWNMKTLNMKEYYEMFEEGKYSPLKQAKLFILDTGVDARHEDIISNFERHKNSSTEKNEHDYQGHGTHCAGIAGAITNNNKGIASMNPGMQWYTISSIKVLNNQGYGSQASIIQGITEAINAGADVISMSLGGRSNQVKEQAYSSVMEYANQKNVIIVAAAGNSANDAAKYVPANFKNVITVAALDRSLKKAQFSNYISNTTNGISAPGVSIYSPWKEGRYSALDGTSMATPHVAGLLAVMRSLNPNLSTDEAHKILDETGIQTKDNSLTGKMINPKEAVKATMK